MPDQAGGPSPAARPVGSVAEETARLLDALLSPAPAQPTTSPDAAQKPADAAYPPSADSVEGPCPTCGHLGEPSSARGAAADLCHLCPVCQVLRVVRSVRPETLDRLADLAAAMTETLRDAAATRWHETGVAPDVAPQTSRPAGPRVHHIAVHDDDGGEVDNESDAADGTDETQEREDMR